MLARRFFFALILLVGGFPVLSSAADSTQPSNPATTWLLHLPGIDGYSRFDRRMIAGLIAGGVSAHIEVFDWTDNDPGIDALHAQTRNHQEAAHIASLIVQQVRQFPDTTINLTAHSGGCGLAVWTLEQLPDDVSVSTVLLLAPALSPEYDLSKALRHVRKNIFVFSSTHDTLILNAGTRIFGTIDGVQTQSAGFAGFIAPPGADPRQYQKLVACPYQSCWQQYDDSGNHLGVLSRPFAAAVLAPLLLAPPQTQPSPSNAHP
jgi:pimeloyl-ACP methyl ester carboxylesterase